MHVVVIDRHLAHNPRERYRQLAAGIHIAEQDVGNRVACFSAAHPRLENRRNVVGDPPNGWRSSVYEHEDSGLTSGVYLFYQVHLPPREGQGATRSKTNGGGSCLTPPPPP